MGEIVYGFSESWLETRKRARLSSTLSVPAGYADALAGLVAYVMGDVRMITGRRYPATAQSVRLVAREKLKGSERLPLGCIVSQQDALDAVHMLMTAIFDLPGLLVEHTHPSARRLIERGLEGLSAASQIIWGDENRYKKEVDEVRRTLARRAASA